MKILMKNYLAQILSLSIVYGTLSPIAVAQSTSFNTTVSAAARINAANALVREGKVSEAIAQYQQVQANDADRDQLNYNLGVAEYRAGNIESAKDHFSESAASSLTSVAARSRYNLGNCFYSDAIKLSANDKLAAIEALREAIGHYRGSLAVEVNNTDARANIELAAQLLKKLQEEHKQDEDQKRKEEEQNQQDQDLQQSAQQEKSQQQPDQDKHNQDQQGSQPQGQQQPDQQNPTPNGEHSSTSEGQMRSDSQRTEQQAQDQSDGESDKSASDAERSQSQLESKLQEHGSERQPVENPPSAESPESMPQSLPKKPLPSIEPRRATSATDQEPESDQAQEQPQAEEQSIPAGELTASGEDIAAENAKGNVRIVAPKREDGLMTKEEALKMLQAVRDRDMLRRLQQERRERSRYMPTDRNW